MWLCVLVKNSVILHNFGFCMEESGMERVKPEGGKADKNALKEKITDL